MEGHCIKSIRYYVELNANCSQLWIMDGSVYKPNDLVRTWEYKTYYFSSDQKMTPLIKILVKFVVR